MELKNEFLKTFNHFIHESIKILIRNIKIYKKSKRKTQKKIFKKEKNKYKFLEKYIICGELGDKNGLKVLSKWGVKKKMDLGGNIDSCI